MTTRPDTGTRPRYGAIEIKDSMQLYWMTGLGLAIAIHMAVIFSYKLASLPGSGGSPGLVTRPIHIIYNQPTINPGGPQPVNVAERAFKNSVGIPVPVAELVADSAVTLAPNGVLNPTGQPGEGISGEETEVTPIAIPDTAPPPWVSVQEMPKIIRRVEPVYPELAILANLEGTVTVKIWVDREGRPREASVVKSNQEILNDAAVAAAKQFLFTPAYMNSGPVSVWVAIPFRFRLADRK